MAIPQYNTWNGDPSNSIAPHRPSTEDVGYDDLENHAEEPPNPRVFPDADGHNQRSKQHASLASTATPARFSIRFSGGAPFIFKAAFARDDNPDTTGWVTDSGTGVTDIVWPADTFPPHAFEPMVSMNEDGRGFAQMITNGVQVTTRDGAGALADLAFTVSIG
jgi:hypothetical protein